MADHEILFHEYPISPFSEKIRRIFAYKNLSYRSVEQPMWMPKPELTPLTAGFRRIPVMQIGADVYCDSALIAAKLEEIAPSPTIYPEAAGAAPELTAAWADSQLFQTAVPLVFGALAEMLPPELLADRQKMRPDLTIDNLTAAAPFCKSSLASYLDTLDGRLGGSEFATGPAFSVADAAIYHCLWFARNAPEPAEMIGARANVSGWMSRLEAMGVGNPTPMTAAEALEIAKTATAAASGESHGGDANGLEPGTAVGVCSDDLPGDVFKGEVIFANAREIAIRHTDDAVGEVAIHFPRARYMVHAG